MVFDFLKRKKAFSGSEDRFFEMLSHQSLKSIEALDALWNFAENGTKECANVVRNIEREADELRRILIQELDSTFITPIDREDIYSMASRLDDVLDLIDAVADRLLLYKIKTPTDGCIAMAKIIVKTAEETDRAVRCLRTLSPYYHKHAVEVNRLENEADRLLRDQLAALFEGATDAFEVIKWKELYETMEAVTDRCEDVVNVIEGITLKMA